MRRRRDPFRAVLTVALLAFAACVPSLPGSRLTGNGGAGQPATGGAGAGGMAGVASPPDAAVATGRGGIAGAAVTGFGGAEAGAGGAPNACNPKPCSTYQPGCFPQMPSDNTVSFFETACPNVERVGGRDGSWFVRVSTGIATVSPSPSETFRVSCGGAFGSCYAACVTGTLKVGAQVDLGFVPRANGAPYDVSAYRGIVFQIRTSIAPTSEARFQVQLAGDSAIGGADLYGTPLGPLADLWQNGEVLFSGLSHRNGSSQPWDPTAVVAFEWSVLGPLPANPSGEPFTLCVDEVVLLPGP